MLKGNVKFRAQNQKVLPYRTDISFQKPNVSHFAFGGQAITMNTNYKNYTVDDFVKDEFFQHWIFSPDVKSDLFWQRVLEENPHQESVMQEARHFLLVFDAKDENLLESDITDLKNRIDRSIDSPHLSIHKTAFAPAPQSKPLKKTSYKKVAVIATIVIVVLILVFIVKQDTVWTKLVFFSPIEQTTDRGDRSLLNLEDGTRVWLNAESRLKYRRSFAGRKSREVYMEGEAFFEVAANKQQPFVVRTSGISVKVLGTSFNIRSYGNDKYVQITLVNGKMEIEISDENRHVTLLPGQQAIFEKESKKITVSEKVVTKDYTVWREGKLTFVNEPLSFIISALERWYDISIHTEDNVLLTCHLTIQEKTQTLEDVLQHLKASYDIQYEVKGKEVFIKGHLCRR